MSVTDEKLLQTISALNRIYSSLALANKTIAEVDGEGVVDNSFEKKLTELDQKIAKGMNDDFNSSELVAQIFEGVRTFNSLAFTKKKKNTNHKGLSESFLKWMRKYGEMSALFNEDPEFMLNRMDDILIEMREINVDKVKDLLNQRNTARAEKDWTLADKLRDELDAMGVELLDGTDRGWKVKVNEQ